MKRRFSTRRVNPKHGRSGPGTEYEVVIRGFDERGYLCRESTVVSQMTGSDGPATRAEAQRHADWLNYAEECFYAGRPAPPIYEWPTTDIEVGHSESDASEAERHLAETMVAGH